MSDEFRIVYSTGTPLKCERCGKKRHKCSCTSADESNNQPDGTVRVRREVKRRGGKTVTVIFGLALSKSEKQALLSDIKKLYGCGGTLRDDTLEIQGDRVVEMIELLRKKGFVVKQAGG